MANHKSARKRALQSVTRNAQNLARKSQVRRLVKAVDSAVDTTDVAAMQESLRAAESKLARIAQKGTIHPRTAARRTSRLARRVAAAAKSAR